MTKPTKNLKQTMSGRGGRGRGGRSCGRAATMVARANDVEFARAFGAVAAAGPIQAPPPPATASRTTTQNPRVRQASEVPRRIWRGKRAPPSDSESDVEEEMEEEMEEEVRPAPAPATARGERADVMDSALPPAAATTTTRASNRDFGELPWQWW